MSTDTAPIEVGPILAALDEENPAAPQIEREFRALDATEVYEGAETSLIRLAVGFRPYVIVVLTDDDEVDEIVSGGYDRDEAVAVLTSAIEALDTATVA
jgi:hypothetical protein